MTTELEEYVQNLQAAYEHEKTKTQQYEKQLGQGQISIYGNSGENPDLIRWQLELDNILEKIEHLLRGDKLGFDAGGNVLWTKATDPEEMLFNDYGVQELLRVLCMYLNRNTILSNYDEETINIKVLDIGWEINDLIFMKYELMGLDNYHKIKNYPMIVRIIVDVVHSAYLRALNGGERQSLIEARHVSQNINPPATIIP